ncbi:hypothetical protein, partial [Streptococcus sobrinus]|uniref:hypothetical protein n=1 Tax=Streptococcus sobrinus TaxID=1310 RepID=UPI0005B5355F
GLALGFTYLWNNSETFKNGVIAGWDAIKTAAQTAWTFIKDTVITPIMTAISTFVLSILNQIKAFWDTNGEQIKTAATN